ncbi:MAG: hypothetical protein ABIG89_01455 [Candidatus Woesearchaeota archaeon]
MNLVSFVYFIHKFDLNLYESYIPVHDGKESSTSLIHTHTNKAGIGKLVNLINPDWNFYYSTGNFYSEYLPAYFPICAISLVVLLFIFSLLVLIKLHSTLIGNIDKIKYSIKSINLYLLFFIISSFTVMKCTLDGGVLEVEFIFWFCVMLATLISSGTISFEFTSSNIFSFLNKSENLKQYIIKIFVFTLAGYYLISLVYLMFDNSIKYIIGYYLMYLSFFFFILFFYVSFKSLIHNLIYKKNKTFELFKGLFLVIIILSSYLAVLFFIITVYSNNTVLFSYNQFNDITLDISANSTSYIYFPREENINGKNNKIYPNCTNLIYGQEDFSIYEFKIKEDTTMHKLWDKYTKLQPGSGSIEINTITCDINKTRNQTKTFYLVKGEVPETINLGFFNAAFTKIDSNESNEKYPKYSYTITSNDCIPNLRHVTERIFNKYGLKSYIITFDELEEVV